jgi:hypothetical protein
VRNCILSFDMTASGLKGANPAPLNPPRILLVVIEALKVALKYSRNLSFMI